MSFKTLTFLNSKWHYNLVINISVSLALPDHFFLFVFVVVEKGSGDIVSIEWCQYTTNFHGMWIDKINTTLICIPFSTDHQQSLTNTN